MSLARPFKIKNSAEFSLNHSKDMNHPKKGAIIRPCISIVADIEKISPCKNSLHPFRNHYAILKVVIHFSIFVSFLVQVV
jgi:hypothetical protein